MDVGHPEIDLALERFRATDDTVRAMFVSLGEYFDAVRKFGDSSGKVTQSLAGFFGSHAPSQESIVGEWVSNILKKRWMECVIGWCSVYYGA